MNASTRLLLVLMSMLGLARVEANETNYFLVGHWLDGELFGDSYVLPLSKLEDIAHARYLISLGPSVWDGPEPPSASGVGANYVYTLETKRLADSQAWVAIPGAEWPLATNQWTLPMTNAEGFFRVKAEELKE
jgi:hypothetical protein